MRGRKGTLDEQAGEARRVESPVSQWGRRGGRRRLSRDALPGQGGQVCRCPLCAGRESVARVPRDCNL